MHDACEIHVGHASPARAERGGQRLPMPPSVTIHDAAGESQVMVTPIATSTRHTEGWPLPSRAERAEETSKPKLDLIESPEFAAAYAQVREAKKPAVPETTGSTEETLRQEQAAQQRQVEEMQQAAAALPPDQRQAMEEMRKAMTAALAQLQNDPQMRQLQQQHVEITIFLTLVVCGAMFELVRRAFNLGDEDSDPGEE